MVEQEINDHFSEYGGPVSVAIATNQLCACLWAGETREDDQWCRALITQVAGDKVRTVCQSVCAFVLTCVRLCLREWVMRACLHAYTCTVVHVHVLYTCMYMY